jgi:hypothetical protein
MENNSLTIIGKLHSSIVHVWTQDPGVSRQVLLTERRRAHYLAIHPELAGRDSDIATAVLDPDEVHRNARDPSVAIFYRRIDASHLMRVVVITQTQPSPLRHSISTARLARNAEFQRGRPRRVWVR